MTRQMKYVLLVEDDPIQLEAYKRAIQKKYDDVVVIGVSTLQGALEQALNLRADAVVVDMFIVDERLPNGAGHELISQLRNGNGVSKFLLMSGFEDGKEWANRLGCPFLAKPSTPAEFLDKAAEIMGN